MARPQHPREGAPPPWAPRPNLPANWRMHKAPLIRPPSTGASPLALPMDLPMDGALPDMPPSKAPAPVPPGRCPRRPLRARVPPPRISIALPRPPQRPSPPPRQLAPLPPHRPHPALEKGPRRATVGPSPRDRGTSDRLQRVVGWAPVRRGFLREGHPARAPTVRSPAAPTCLTQHNAATMASSNPPGPDRSVRGCVVPGLPPVRSPGARAPGQTAAQRTGEYPKSHYSAARRRGLAHDDPQGVVLVQSAPHSPPGGHNSQEVAPLGPPAQPVQQTGEYPESHIQPPMEGAFPQ
ncbi:hypothetical protein N7472_011003 [Penicillium cf. griseofulvum]|uniref:Uncharacterized protein n=1 Tax=Penicillium cf. griseofulvum TaxID=2972120 RepID=A0A9W9IW45_9EURO|nr:hypothetical protein N7472_011003 [Penicillium cf. griseofulvum]